MKTIALLAIILMQATSEVIDMSNKMAEIEMVEALEQIEGKIENEQLLLDFLNDEKMLREEKDYLRTFSQTKNVSSKTRQTTEFQNETGSSSKETSQKIKEEEMKMDLLLEQEQSIEEDYTDIDIQDINGSKKESNERRLRGSNL